MVQAIINISDDANRVLNIVKAKYSLRNKSAAIDRMAKEYEDMLLEPELKPEFVQRVNDIRKERPVYVGSVEELRRLIESDEPPE